MNVIGYFGAPTSVVSGSSIGFLGARLVVGSAEYTPGGGGPPPAPPSDPVAVFRATNRLFPTAAQRLFPAPGPIRERFKP